ncbi:DNA polymerase delta, subunit 4-domain-containing protein [Syncephalastrum racemosum]|uniref:DNA polymerase delta, subunit 4-domain-containing protein n=1 Tax=Syncephalastrum racemosum TaxID=13706 RepID=A0A1X2HU33_SYNRA|nr:DNA polymerase delta, subunit 4-domain-containing protein [Syncephalastrum racemosum]
MPLKSRKKEQYTLPKTFKPSRRSRDDDQKVPSKKQKTSHAEQVPATLDQVDDHSQDSVMEIHDDDDLLGAPTREEPQIIHRDVDAHRHTRVPRMKKPKTIEIHRSHLDATEKMLRQFDLNYAYGPCVNISRLERWNRAEMLGLKPPKEIKIAIEKNPDKRNHNLFEGEVI